MAENRMVLMKFWNDKYIQSLHKDEKLLFLYLLTNERTQVCGLYEITERTIINETELTPEFIKNTLDKFSKDKKMIYEDGLLFIPKYAFYQSASKLQRFSEHLEKVFNLYQSYNNLPFFLFCVKYNQLINHLFSEGLNSVLTGDYMNNEQWVMDNEQRAKSPEKICLFKNSEYFDFEKFKERFNSNPDYAPYDAKYYYESALNWSNANNKKKADWIATVYNWCRRDITDNKPHYLKKETIKLN